MKQQLLQKFEEWLKFWWKSEQIMCVAKHFEAYNGGEYPKNGCNICLELLLERVNEAISQTEREEKERQYDMMMKCLPSDAENLSTLTPDQAFRLIKCFIKKNPWG